MAASKGTLDPGDSIDELALALYRLAGDESIRVLEAIAATLANRQSQGEASDHPCALTAEEASGFGLAEPPSVWLPTDCPKWQVCRRIARRAVRGSLPDPTCGATAFHHIEASPPWCRDHLPVAVHGPFLFYRL